MKYLVVLFLAFMFLFVAAPVYGQVDDLCSDTNQPLEFREGEFCTEIRRGTSSENPVTGESGILTSAINILSFIVGVVSIIGLLFGGFLYTTAAGDSGRVSRGKSAITYSLVGLVVAIFAQGIVIFVLNRL